MRLSQFNDMVFKLHKDFPDYYFLMQTSANGDTVKLKVLNSHEKKLCILSFETFMNVQSWGNYDSLTSLIRYSYVTCDKEDLSDKELNFIYEIVERFDGE